MYMYRAIIATCSCILIYGRGVVVMCYCIYIYITRYYFNYTGIKIKIPGKIIVIKDGIIGKFTSPNFKAK